MKFDNGQSMLEQCFFGSATVGERGQIVIPAEARKECEMASGDKILVFRHPMHPKMLILAHVTDMQELHKQMLDAINHLEQLIITNNDTESDEDKGDSNA